MARMLVLAALCVLQLQCCSSCYYDSSSGTCVDPLGDCAGIGTCTSEGHGGVGCWCAFAKAEESTKLPLEPQGGALQLSYKDCGDASTHAKITGLAPSTATI